MSELVRIEEFEEQENSSLGQYDLFSSCPLSARSALKKILLISMRLLFICMVLGVKDRLWVSFTGKSKKTKLHLNVHDEKFKPSH